MVGEIRDPETAEISVRAASTGHLVLSSIHTNDAPSALTRLVDMGVPPYITSSALLGVVAQRLVRILCPECKKQTSITKERAARSRILPRRRSSSSRSTSRSGATHARSPATRAASACSRSWNSTMRSRALFLRAGTCRGAATVGARARDGQSAPRCVGQGCRGHHRVSKRSTGWWS